MAGGLFILPGVVALMALSIVYAEWGQVGFVAAAFFGLKAAVLAIVVEAVIRIGRRSLKSGPLQALAAAAFVAIFFFAVPFPIIIVAAGLIGFFGARAGYPAFMAGIAHGKAKPGPDGESLLGEAIPDHAHPSRSRTMRVAAFWLALWLAPTIAIAVFAGTGNVFTSIAVFFSKMALVTFGGAYAVLAYVAQQAVSTYHWVTPGEMLDGLGMAETTPGPLIMVLQFVGFMAAFRAPGLFPPLLAGALGGLLATWVTFTPCFLWIFVGAPYIEQLRGNKLPDRRALGDNGGCRRRHSEPGDLVRHSHDVPCNSPHRRTRDELRRARSIKPRRLEPHSDASARRLRSSASRSG